MIVVGQRLGKCAKEVVLGFRISSVNTSSAHEALTKTLVSFRMLKSRFRKPLVAESLAPLALALHLVPRPPAFDEFCVW